MTPWQVIFQRLNPDTPLPEHLSQEERIEMVERLVLKLEAVRRGELGLSG